MINPCLSVEDAQTNLESWWEDTGRSMLFGCSADADAEDPEECVASDEENDEDLQKLSSSSNHETIHAIAMLEKEAQLKQHILEEASAPEEVDERSQPTAEEDVSRPLPELPAHRTLWEILVPRSV